MRVLRGSNPRALKATPERYPSLLPSNDQTFENEDYAHAACKPSLTLLFGRTA